SILIRKAQPLSLSQARSKRRSGWRGKEPRPIKPAGYVPVVEGDLCPNCRKPLFLDVREELPTRLPDQRFYFDFWLRCAECGTCYYLREACRVYKWPTGDEIRGI